MGLDELEIALSTGKTIYFIGYRLHENDRIHVAKDEKGKAFYTDFSEANTARDAYAKTHTTLEVTLKKLISSDVKTSSE